MARSDASHSPATRLRLRGSSPGEYAAFGRPRWVWHLPVGLAAALGTAALVGCSKTDEIQTYRVEKQHLLDRQNPGRGPAGAAADTAGAAAAHAAANAADAAARDTAAQPAGQPTHRTLAAMIPQQNRSWFFKVMGPIEAVGPAADSFRKFMESVGFGADGAPTWTLPDGWRDVPSPTSGFVRRHATIRLEAPDKPPLELAVTVFPTTDVLANVNRWRNELSLPPLARDQLEEHTTTVALDGATATLVDLSGRPPSDAARPPFARP